MHNHLVNSAGLEFYATDGAVAQLEANLAAASEVDRPSALLAVAWQLRQRGTERALALANIAQTSLDTHPSLHDSETQRRLRARMLLIRGEAALLAGELNASSALCNTALQEFAACNDAIGCADTYWLQFSIAVGEGNAPGQHAALRAVAAEAQRGADPVRVTVAQAAFAARDVYSDSPAAQQQWNAWAAQFAKGTAGIHPAAATWVDDFFAAIASQSGQYVDAIRHHSSSYTQALATGQIRRAVVVATNLGVEFSNLNDHHTALEWMQRGMDLARPQAWPGTMGVALLQTAGTLRELQRFDAAHELLREAMVLMAPLAASRNYAVALRYLGEVELKRRQYAEALAGFQLLEQRATALKAADLLCNALCGQAQALLDLDQPQPALTRAHAALAAAQSHTLHQIDALRVLADIHTRHTLPLPSDMTAASAALHYLQRALEAAATIDDYTVPGDLLEALACEHAKVGSHVHAYQLALQAIQAHDKIRSTAARNHASAMQVSHEFERTKAEGEHQRQLAQTQAERGDMLERANGTLEQLGNIGREITGNLDMQAIFVALDTHVRALLEVTTLWIYRLEPDGQSLKMVFGVESGHRLGSHITQLDDPERKAARCARERQEIMTSMAPGQGLVLEGTLETLSQMFSPLMVGERLLGVMTIQSKETNAYAEREVAIFRTLCAYAAIALANAEVQAQLKAQNALLKTLSGVDKLTGLANRLRLDQVLSEELERGKRTGAELSVILVDIDHFKAVNDSHGHQIGDQMLMAIGKILNQNSRQVDLVGRWGGEEFLIVCPETKLAGASLLAEKLRCSIAAQVFPVVGHKTGSFGVASLGGLKDIDDLISRADAALYRAKKNGRNRVEIDGQSDVSAASSSQLPPANLGA
nr:GGDEF domain-containing protein [Rhodoferax sp.]